METAKQLDLILRTLDDLFLEGKWQEADNIISQVRVDGGYDIVLRECPNDIRTIVIGYLVFSKPAAEHLPSRAALVTLARETFPDPSRTLFLGLD